MENGELEHIPAYTTLISINEIKIKEFQEKGAEAFPILKPYLQMQYNNDSIDLYKKEFWILNKMDQRKKIKTSDFLKTLNEKSQESPVKVINSILNLDQNTKIVDDLGMFQFDSQGSFDFSVDFFYNVESPGYYICCGHYITDVKIDLTQVYIFSEIDFKSKSKILEFLEDYLVIEQNKEQLESRQQMMLITILKIDVTDEDFNLEYFGFSIFPLYMIEGSFMQGVFQLPVFQEEMNTYIYDLFQRENPWNIMDELVKDKTLNMNSSLIIRSRIEQFRGWNEKKGNLLAVNTMFMPELIPEESIASQDRFDELKGVGEELRVSFGKKYDGVRDVVDEVVLTYFEELMENRKG